MSAIDKDPFPRGPLIAAAVLVGFSLVAAGVGRYTTLQEKSQAAVVQPAPARSLALTFVDEADGAVSVHHSASGALVTILEPGTNGFVRTVLRSMVRDRRSRGIDREPPFLLSQWSNGTLILEDTATGRRIDLRAFGPTNKEAFLRILNAEGAGG